jgi:hypothetical protein
MGHRGDQVSLLLADRCNGRSAKTALGSGTVPPEPPRAATICLSFAEAQGVPHLAIADGLR